MGYLLDWYMNSEKFKDKVNMNVIEFIDKIITFPDLEGKTGGHIDHLFSAGYCYYFANILKIAFGGQVCWPQDRGHIVWVDVPETCTFEELQNGCAYDICGIYDDYEAIWPISYLGDAVVDFMHNGKSLHIGNDFKDWCDFYHISEIYAINIIWRMIPMKEIMMQYRNGLDFIQTAYQYWIKHKEKIQQIVFYECKNKLFVLPSEKHSGIDTCLKEIKNKDWDS